MGEPIAQLLAKLSQVLNVTRSVNVGEDSDAVHDLTSLHEFVRLRTRRRKTKGAT